MARHTTKLFEADLRELIARYTGRISTAEAIGVLMLAVYEVVDATNDGDEEAADG